MARFEIEYPGRHEAPSTGISKPAQKISKAAESVQNILPSLGDIGRNVVRGGARIAEAALGAPADLATAALGLGSLAEQVTQGEPQIVSKLHEAARGYLPTSENIRKYGTEKIAEKVAPEGYLTPQNEWEEYLDNFVDTAASFASPLIGPAKVGLKQAAKLAGTGGLAGWGAKKLGFGETGQAVASAGAMLATTFAGAPRMVDRAKGLYDKAKKAVRKATPAEIENILKDMPRRPHDISRVGVKDISSSIVEKGLAQVTEEINKGLSSPAKNIARKDVEDMLSKIKNGRINLEEIAQSKFDINKRIYKSTNKADYEAASEYLKPLKDSLIETIKESAPTHPEFAKNLLEADEIWAALKEEDFVSKFLNKRIDVNYNELKSPLTVGLLTALGGAAIEPFFPGTGKYVALGGLGLAGYSGYKAARIFAKSPQARKYYGELISSSLKKNVPQTLKAIRKLDHIFSVEDEESPQSQGRYEVSFQ